jgi:hypothetical protein
MKEPTISNLMDGRYVGKPIKMMQLRYPIKNIRTQQTVGMIGVNVN